MCSAKLSGPSKIAHIGIAVSNIKKVLPFYTDTLGLHLEGIEEVDAEKVKVAFLKIGESRIELLEPLDKQSPIKKFLEKKGEGIHHIALEVGNIEDRLKQLKEDGVQLINEQPKHGAGNNLIAFIHPKSANGVLYEMCEQLGKGEV